MPGRKKGRQRGSAGGKAQRARRWDDAMREAREDLASDRRPKLVRGGDSAPPRLSVQGFRSLATLLHQRVRSDQRDASARPAVHAPRIADQLAGATAASKVLAESTDHHPRRARTLMSLCISQIGKDFLAYHAEDHAVAQAFLLLPTACLSRLSRAASARGTIADHNVGLLCIPGVDSLCLRGRFTDQGAGVLLPALRMADAPTGEHRSPEDAVDLAEVYRNGNAEVEGENPVDGASGLASPQPANESGGETEDWEGADDRVEACLHGGISLTSLDVSSPLITSAFIERLVSRIPSLRRLGIRGSLDLVGGPDAVCDHVPRLLALRELDVSHCSWFCDIGLRRFAKALSREGSLSRSQNFGYTVRGSHWMLAAGQVNDGASGWGAASASATNLEQELQALDAGEFNLGSRACGDSGERGSPAEAARFRTFTLTCARTAVTERGARVAESLSPGLLVVLEDKGVVGGVLRPGL